MPATQARQRNRTALTSATPPSKSARYSKPIPVAGRDAATSRLHNLIWLLTITTAFFALFQLHRIYIRKLPPISLNPLPDHLVTDPPPPPVDPAQLAKERAAQDPLEAVDRLEFVDAYKAATGEKDVPDKADGDAEGMDKLDAETLQKMYDALHSRGAYSDDKQERKEAEEQGRDADGVEDEKKTRSKRFLNLAKNLAKNVVSGMEGDSAEEIELKDDADLQK